MLETLATLLVFQAIGVLSYLCAAVPGPCWHGVAGPALYSTGTMTVAATRWNS
jgi:hypothetical protein